MDCIIDVISLTEYYKISERLRKNGFKQSPEDSVICRWRIDGVILDIMPTDEKILGFGNQWYQDAIQQSMQIELDTGTKINIVTAAYFLATKLEAFKTRGNNDFLASHYFEDIIGVIDGRVEIAEEVLQSPSNVRDYLSNNIAEIIQKAQFLEALPGHLNYGAVTNERVQIVLEKLRKIVG